MAASGGKNRKYGRGKKRPSNASYTNARRWISNKEKRIAKDAKMKQHKRDNPVAKGVARAKRREHLQKGK